MQNLLFVTGGAGFIGGNFIRHGLQYDNGHIVNIDKLTYAGNPDTVRMLDEEERHMFIEADIIQTDVLKKLFTAYRPNRVVHFAAESHVDRSIENPCVFVQTNIIGTFCLLEAVKHYFHSLSHSEKKVFRFLHVSTDEVFGTLGLTGTFHENNPYAPSTPYSATKGASNLLVHAWHKTYGIPILTVNCSNNYGPFQAPEKLMPKTILHAIQSCAITIHGNGTHVRDWLFVEDCCDGIMTVLNQGIPGENYSIGGNCERTTQHVVESLCNILDDSHGRKEKDSFRHLIRYIPDRPANDFRYSLNTRKIEAELGWKAKTPFEDGIRRTVFWYLEHRKWLFNAAERLKSEPFLFETFVKS